MLRILSSLRSPTGTQCSSRVFRSTLLFVNQHALCFQASVLSKSARFSTKAAPLKRASKAWKKGLEELKSFKEQHGHARVPFRYVNHKTEGKPYKLGNWVSRQRTQYRLFVKGEPSFLDSKRIAVLEELGFQWDAKKEPAKAKRSEKVVKSWTEHYEELKLFKEKHSHCNVQDAKADASLLRWVRQQRRQYKLRVQGKPASLTDEDIVALEDLGFIWDPKYADLHNLSWNEWFGMLQEYQKEHGDCSVPKREGNLLGKWIAYQRSIYKILKEGNVIVPSLTPERIKALDELGFKWESPRNRSWEDWLEMLRHYKAEHGDCHVLASSGPLGRWVARQRRFYRQRQNGKHTPLTDEKIHQLEGLGVKWVASNAKRETKWNERLDELRLYKQTHGNCRVPTAASIGGLKNEHAQLGIWVKYQREQYKLFNEGRPTSMTSERIAALEDLEFEWELRPHESKYKEVWKAWRRQLLQYKEKHGDCRPSREEGNLAKWIDQQRYQYHLWRRGKESSMNSQRIASLLELGFEWDNHKHEAPRQTLNGTWNPADPLVWTSSFGRRSAKSEEMLRRLAQLQPGELGYFDVSETVVPSVSIVRTKDQARTALDRLVKSSPSVLHACDAKVMGINLKKEGPVGNGYVTSMTIYSGPDFDYGLGDGPGTTLWIDNLDESYGLVREFTSWLENDRHVKVWHNYGFVRHLLWNEGIDCHGFGGDIMHMARLQDTRRAITGNRTGYSLDGLLSAILKEWKPAMMDEFGIQTTTSHGERTVIPPVEVMQRDPRFREKFIKNFSSDTRGIWGLRNELQRELERMPWFGSHNMYDFYSMYMKRFGVVLTEMERRGIRLDTENLMSRVKEELQNDRKMHVMEFRTWASSKIGPNGWTLDPEDPMQLRTFLFGDSGEQTTLNLPYEDVPFEDMSDLQLRALCKSRGLDISGKRLELLIHLGLDSTEAWSRIRVNESAHQEREKRFTVQRSRLQEDKWDLHLNELREYLAAHGHCHVPTSAGSSLSNWVSRQRHEYWRRAEGKSSSMTDERIAALEELRFEWVLRESTAAESRAPSGDRFDVVITSLGIPAERLDSDGEASVSTDVLRKLAGNPFRGKYGSAYDFFGGGKEGHDACVALYSLYEIDVINRHKANFWTHLESVADEQSRVHCSINLNTETGRVLSRRPALENQPSHLIRKVFNASPGNNLIVANYRQLEFRLLASMSNCDSMIRLFREGGDIHARTTYDMYDHVKKAVNEERCLLEWDSSQGKPKHPLLCDMFPNERQIAKDLNFLVLAGEPVSTISLKTGLPQTTVSSILKTWHESYPETLVWQAEKKYFAKKHGVARTLLGRYRLLRDGNGAAISPISDRVSMTTPIEGSVADISMLAMLKLSESDLLRRLGWVLLMQMNNEVLLEGPKETAEEALFEVKLCMQEQWGVALKNSPVPIEVDGSCKYSNWFDAQEF